MVNSTSRLLQTLKNLSTVKGIIIVLSLFSISSCNQTSQTGSPTYPFRSIKTLSAFEKNGVQVDIVLEEDAKQVLIIATTFSPIEAGYHLYSKDLPLKGIDGVGRPTLVKIEFPNLTVESRTYESVMPINLYLEGFSQPFPIYPEGSITLRTPISIPIDKVAKQISGHAYITYMACSDSGTCLVPVIKEKLEIELPRP
jgi:hypothetical protein